VIVNLDNKIVGLLFASGANVPVGGTPQPFVTLANHISDVFSELNIKIDYSPDVVVVSGAALIEVPAGDARVPAAYRDLRARMDSVEATASLMELGRAHRDEVVRLVNHCRPVTVAWHRAQGPQWLATLIDAVREQRYDLPSAIRGVTLVPALERMRSVLSEHGSASLREAVGSALGDRIIEACRTSTNLNEMIDCFSCAEVSGD
jgi:hypothetical protein